MFSKQTHTKSVHEGQKFQCPQCEYKATFKVSLQTHIKSVHEGQKFPCPQCEYKATQKGHLQTHIKSVHEGQKFQCPQCEYKATWKLDLLDTQSQYMKVKSFHVNNVNTKLLSKEAFRNT